MYIFVKTKLLNRFRWAAIGKRRETAMEKKEDKKEDKKEQMHMSCLVRAMLALLVFELQVFCKEDRWDALGRGGVLMTICSYCLCMYLCMYVCMYVCMRTTRVG